jgi:hypothetical protein
MRCAPEVDLLLNKELIIVAQFASHLRGGLLELHRFH